MVRLFFENTNLPGPVAAVRWCVDRVDLDYLKEKGITDPFLALIITKPREEKDSDGTVVYEVVDHKVVPLDQAMEYLEFRSSGELRIFGQLVWCEYHKKRKLNQNKLGEHIGKTSSYSFDYVIESMEFNNLTSGQLESGYADVTVPEGHFAKEPSAWEKWWVNFWYESKPKNQCQFRKRRMLAYTIQPLVVTTYALIRSLLLLGQILIFMLVGARKIKYGAMFHPFSYELGEWEIVPDKRTSVFTKDVSGKERNPLFLMSIPLVQIILFVVSLLVWKFILSEFVSLWVCFVALNVALIIFVLIVETGVLDKLFPEETDEEMVVRRKREMEAIYAEYQDMICIGVSLKADLSVLPPKRRTFHLKFQDFRRRVCLPFAK
ncbi:MAG: hypothetical protein A3B86_03305 [Candidatus Yanofskybacteria bacterium RIFCSPHIGHO2_02_FULL_38_22b]|uniref:Uncharacterized protein n=1 Tax=Candidatus Yanofskybacteria bacterium RIFCSPHIGHO2_02_FULL_38_22b TaxID=1802673 RepID=A0A1F8F2V3_9BACT|nr:MAG: hypothetical protein A3B86_03305 [Candidatus Yanofskybacteria bacterium RIFCSPHIGHO2_02_FULL_38_22b]OGN19875.1 MAG: hypothetical protein A2910_01880 [Candidatus Yanofskybacteria bacterium RIFCSPLOWO2_01_FULL_39_28]